MRQAIDWHFPGYLGYGLDSGLSEQRNLVADQPELTKRLHEKRQAWWKAINAPMPQQRGQKQ